MNQKIKVTLIKSPIGKSQKQRATIAGLGLKKLNETIEMSDTPEVRGMISKITHMLNIA